MDRKSVLCRPDGKESRMDWLTVIGVLGGWILLQYVILPKLGVPT